MDTTTHTHQLTSQVKLLQKVAVWHLGECLILRRASDTIGYRSGKWDLPGGNAEWPVAADDVLNPHYHDLAREVVEETGIDMPTLLGQAQWDAAVAREQGFLGSTSSVKPSLRLTLFSTYFEASKQLYAVIVGWCMMLPDSFVRSQVRLSSEHTQMAWITLEQLEEYDFGFAGEPNGFIRRILEECSR